MDSIQKQLESWGMSPDEAAWALALAAGETPDPEREAWEQYMEEEGWLYEDEEERLNNFRLWEIGRDKEDEGNENGVSSTERG